MWEFKKKISDRKNNFNFLANNATFQQHKRKLMSTERVNK